MARVFLVKPFGRWARKNRILERTLCQAVEEMRAGLIDADLGAGLVKKRIPVGAHGKRGGGRTILATSIGAHTFFLFGYMKNERADLLPEELIVFKRLALELLTLREAGIDLQLATRELQEICHGNRH